MMSQCIVPKWNQRQQRQEKVEGGEEGNRSSHVHSHHQNLTYVVPMSNYEEVTELTWENGQLGLHGLGEINLPPPPTKQTTSTWRGTKPEDTLESLVHQATFNNCPHKNGEVMEVKYSTSVPTSGKWGENPCNSHLQQINGGVAKAINSSIQENSNGGATAKLVNSINAAASSGGKWGENMSKRVRSEYSKGVEEGSACASASENTICRDTTMMTWTSFESPRNFKSPRITTDDDDSTYQDCSETKDGEGMTKGESFRSQSSARRSRAAAVHNQSERRRRDRINEKMKALQKLVPNASKTDKASMLDEVIEYLKQLQAQVHMMSNARNMPQMVMPLGMQQQLQMSLLARMGMGMGMAGMGMGMIDVNNLARNSFPPLLHATTPLGGTAPSFVSPPFGMPPMVPHQTPLRSNVDTTNINTPVPNFNDAYNTFIAQQSMNMDFLNKMAAIYRQQASQPSKKPVTSSSLPNDAHHQRE
ncbi:hypothetical protein DH2020_038101 [Rehmannia glutinosa]|uniref:BHLH domain-containing protein n=1 Tax=Rehmannia glutinosa TaxID=99300 RepID=A0ABR0V0S2_REHGL